MTKLYLIRHGQTLWNKISKYQGHSDIALSDTGIAQAQKLGHYLFEKGIKLQAVYASDLSRAYDTAKLIAEPYNLPISTNSELREMNFGVWEGLTFKEIKNQYSDLAEIWLTAPETLEIPKGESFAKVKERAINTLYGILKNHANENIAVVSHGGTLRTIICSLLDMPLSKMWQFKLDNTALTIFNIYNDKPILSLFNFTAHLDEINNL